jgi:hypothetical protein
MFSDALFNKKLAGFSTLIMVLACSGFLHAQPVETRPLSPSVVLVLKLVSSTRAQPTTGIVMSDEGLVLVPADFISADGEMIVLDGGTDIIKNGRPATALDKGPVNGWALISVAGLERPGITLSAQSLRPSSGLHLTAFPPAEYIARGLPPLWSEVKVQRHEASDTWSISGETPQPDISGPILDDCGYLSGLKLATGLPAVNQGEPVSLFADSVRQTLQALGLRMSEAECAADAQSTLAVESGAPGRGTDNSLTPTDDARDLLGPEDFNPRIPRKRLNPFQGAMPDPAVVEKPSLWQLVPAWLWFGGFAFFALLTWKGLMIFRLHRPSAKPDTNAPPALLENPEFDEQPRSAAQANPGMPDLTNLPAGCDMVLVIEVLEDANTRYKRYCVTNSNKVDAVIGAGDTKIQVKHPSVSPEHARISGSAGQLFLTDLGSSQGTFVNGIPCLSGEVFYANPGDEVFLGKVQLFFTMIRQDESSL